MRINPHNQWPAEALHDYARTTARQRAAAFIECGAVPSALDPTDMIDAVFAEWLERIDPAGTA